MVTRPILFLAALVFLFPASAWAQAGAETEDLEAVRREALALLQGKRYEDAIRKYAVLIRADENDSNALYNMACACSLLGKKAYAVAFLERAVRAGFIDFGHIARDKDLDPLREEPEYKALLKNRAALLQAGNESRIARYRERLGDRYAFVRDDTYNLLMITNVSAALRARLFSALRRYAQAWWRDFFKHKPDYLITVLVPRTSQDYVRDFHGRSGAAGFYSHATRTLTVNLQTGTGTMIHEFAHALHYADMENLGQRHPTWIVEGFGSLYEQCTIRADGAAVGLTNWRLVRNLQPGLRGEQTYLPWKKVMDPKSGVFRDRSAVSMAYAVTRYVFYYMQEKQVLRKFYAAYRSRYKEDPTGVKFMEELLGKKRDDLETEWKPWVLTLRYERPGRSRTPTVRLGVVVEPSSGGLAVRSVSPGSCAEKAGLRVGDVILSLNGSPLPSTSKLLSILLWMKPGQTVKLRLRRGSEERDVDVVLDRR